jgi:hypothetical protein
VSNVLAISFFSLACLDHLASSFVTGRTPFDLCGLGVVFLSRPLLGWCHSHTLKILQGFPEIFEVAFKAFKEGSFAVLFPISQFVCYAVNNYDRGICFSFVHDLH